MGYDIMVLDGTRRERLAFDELWPDEWRSLGDASRLRTLPMLTTLPDFYSEERTFSPEGAHALLGELDRLDAEAAIAPDLARASQKLRRMARAAIQHGAPLLVVPD